MADIVSAELMRDLRLNARAKREGWHRAELALAMASGLKVRSIRSKSHPAGAALTNRAMISLFLGAVMGIPFVENDKLVWAPSKMRGK